MAVATVTVPLTVNVTDCPACGIQFGITADFERRRRESHQGFYCPNGHVMSYGHPSKIEQEAADLRQKLRSQEAKTMEAEQEAADARIAAQRSRAELERVTRRVKAGVCPHCNRTFKQLAAHMKSKHQCAASSFKGAR